MSEQRSRPKPNHNLKVFAPESKNVVDIDSLNKSPFSVTAINRPVRPFTSTNPGRRGRPTNLNKTFDLTVGSPTTGFGITSDTSYNNFKSEITPDHFMGRTEIDLFNKDYKSR